MTEIKNNQLDQTKNVLLASQSPHIVRLVLEILARKGIRGLVAGNTRNALDFLDKNDCAMAIIEDMIPHKSGGPANKDGAFELLAQNQNGQTRAAGRNDSGR